MERVVLGLGSNIGSRRANLQKALKEISLIKGVNILAVSSVYETEPWGLKKQRKFFNCAAVCMCKLSPDELMASLHETERGLGRRRRVKWAPRTIDIDILFFGSRIIKKKNIEIPHPRVPERNFVLVPLNELIPRLIHPVLKKKISVILQRSRDNCKTTRLN
jgi:dihydroneopterin aldolase/2-amino-4-hydroxy-6-hydroxymethyldihydropteridine diphosphokinase